MGRFLDVLSGHCVRLATKPDGEDDFGMVEFICLSGPVAGPHGQDTF